MENSLHQEGLKDTINRMFKINFRKLIKLLEADGFYKDSDKYGLKYIKGLDLTMDDDEEGIVSVRFTGSREHIIVEISEEGFVDSEIFNVFDLSKKSDAEIKDIFKKIKSKVERTDRPSPNSAAYKAFKKDRDSRRLDQSDEADQPSWMQENNGTRMKKSELKALLKIITEEVIAEKQARLNESKGLSGFKKSKESTEHTEKVADSKSLTPNSEPKEKEEGKKLPVVKKPATPQKVGSIKEDILQMIREEIDEMARVKGAVGSKFKVEDPSSPTGWVVKGHKTIPDGTPTEAPKGPYVKKGDNPNMGRPKSTPSVSVGSSPATDARTEEAVEDYIKYNPDANEHEVIDAIGEKSSEETPLNLDPAFVKKAIDNAKKNAGSDDVSGEPDIASVAAAEKKEKEAKINKLRAFLMKKKGLK